MASISVYTTCTNAMEDEFFLIEAIKSALLFADEVIIVDGGSTDSTISKIKEIQDPRIKVFHNKWLDSLGKFMYAINKSISLGRCTSDWCVLLDSDEVFHEEDIERIRRIPNHVSENILAVEFNTIHFYKDYKHILNGYDKWPGLYHKKIYMIRNNMCVHHGPIGNDPDAHVDFENNPIPEDRIFTSNINVFHYGHVRTTDSYIKKRNKFKGMYSAWGWIPETKETFRWMSTEDLVVYAGTHPSVMKDRIDAGLNHNKIMDLYSK